jgi:hypothetical protein
VALDTVADYIARSRTLLTDVIPPYRYTDDVLVDALNDGIMESRRLRPDMWLSVFRASLPSFTSATPSAAVAIDPMYRMSFIYYMCGLAQLADEEDVQDQRAMAFLNKFVTQLTSMG